MWIEALRARTVGLVLLRMLAVSAPSALGASLATERYGTEDGLAGDSVTAVLADSRGFVWLGTTEGLSRFDGDSFTNFGVADGLPSSYVTDLDEAKDGSIWISTTLGLARVTSEGPVAAAVEGLPQGRRIDSLDLQDAEAAWVVVEGVVYRMSTGEDRLRASKEAWADGIRETRVIASGGAGEVWIGTVHDGLFRVSPDGRLDRFLVVPLEGSDGVTGLRVADDGALWIGTLAGLFIFRPDAGTDPRPLVDRAAGRTFRPGEVWTAPASAGEVTHLVRESAGRFDLIVLSPFVDDDGTIWAVTSEQLLRSEGGTWTLLGAESGIDVDALTAGDVDDGGNVWLGTLNGGALVVRRHGFVSYGRRDGLGTVRIQQVTESPEGELLVVAGWQLHRLDEHRFRAVDLAPKGQRYQGWGWHQVLAFDGEGDAWVASGEGLFRYRGARRFDDFARIVPRRYTTRDGLGGDDVFRVWTDGEDVWVGTFGRTALARYDRERDRFVGYPAADGLPLRAPTAFARDGAGAIWIGLYDGGLSRFAEGRFTFFDETSGLPPGFVHALHADAKGRLWVATSRGGVCVVDRPDSDTFDCRVYSVDEGLSSSSARALAEDDEGAMWVGTSRGVDRIEPESGTIRHFTRHDGLASNIVTAALRDRDGSVWFGTVGGLSRTTGDEGPAVVGANTLITEIDVNGAARVASPLGLESLHELRFGAETERVEIRYAAPRMAARGPLRYEYRLSGLDPGWRSTSAGRVTFDRLPYRAFRFEVRAVSDDGHAAAAAVVPFRIESPLWMRWWFVVGVASLVMTLAYLWYRTHVAHLLAVERMRTQIATDLHDDLGSSLSRISILSEIAKMQVDESGPASRILGDIGENARALVGALGDSIWSIDPRVDDLRSLVARARHHAVEMFEGAGIASRFDVEDGLEVVHLDPVQRRQIFLILKEALNNIAKHSAATHVVVSIQIVSGNLLVEIVDDGRGFDPASVGPREHGTGGRGVGSMRGRAEALGGRLEIASVEGEGTTLVFEVPTTRGVRRA